MKLAALLLLAGCWTSQPPPPEPPAPPPPPPKRVVVKKPPAAQPPAAPPSPYAAAQALGKQLRSDGPQAMPLMISGPVVVLDLDSGAINTLCGRAAENAAVSWGTMIVDPQRSDPMCIAGPNQTFTCVQSSGMDVLVIELEDPTQWRIRTVTVGNQSNARAAMRANLTQLRAQATTATCP